MATLAVARPRSRRKRRGNGIGRTAYGRIVHIHERLGNERRVNATTLAAELDVSPRTVKRDIGQMRVELGAPIVWEPSTQTYFYDKPCDLLPLLRLTADEALALVLAGETFAAWRGSPLGRALTAALRKIAGVAGGVVSLPVSEVRNLISQPGEGEETKAEHRWFAAALEAIRRRRELRLSYRKPRRREPEDRLVHPLHLAYLEHRWMLVAFDPARRGPRNFLLARIHDATATGAHFEPPAGFDPRSYLAGSIGRFTGDREHVVRVIFDATVAPYLRERPWHPSQTIVDRADGAIEVTLRLNNLVDVHRHVLACGSHAEVLAPAELRESVGWEIAAMTALYRQTVADGEPAALIAAEAPAVYATEENPPAGHPVSPQGVIRFRSAMNSPRLRTPTGPTAPHSATEGDVWSASILFESSERRIGFHATKTTS